MARIYQMVRILILILLLTSCHRDDSYYCKYDETLIRLIIDWGQCGLKPNGVSVIIFKADGNLYKEFISANRDTIELTLPEGVYNLYLYNDTKDELNNTMFSGSDRIENFVVFSIPKKQFDSSFFNTYESKLFVEEPDTLAFDEVNNLSITKPMLEYFPDKPLSINNTIIKEIHLTPRRIVTTVNVNVRVRGLNNVITAPVVVLDNMSHGYYPNNKNKSSKEIVHHFYLNNVKFDDENKIDGVLSNKICTFGLANITKSNGATNLSIKFSLRNGEKHLVVKDVSNIIEEANDKYNKMLNINLDITLPKIIGSDESGKNGNVFDPKIGNWDDVMIDVLI